MFGAVLAAEGTDRAALDSVAREFSPRIEVCGPREITLDLSGLTRLFGDARTIAQELRRTAADRGLRVRVAIAATRSAARLFVHHRAGLTVIEPGDEAEMLAPLPLPLLPVVASNATDPTVSTDPNVSNELLSTLRRWGVHTLGECAALPPDDVAARLGHAGVEWQRLARGEDPRPLVPAASEERFEQTLDLEWPIAGLEPLSFVLARLLEPLAAHLERRDRGAAVLHVRLRLVTRAVHARSLQLPAPMRDPRVLRTLALLDLESHPPDAAIDRVTVAVDPTPGRVVQFSLLTRPLPSPAHLSTLMARLTALMGEGRCGCAEPVDTWRPGAFAMTPFAPRESPEKNDTPRHRAAEDINQSRTRLGTSGPQCVEAVDNVANPVLALRRFRTPIPARVTAEEGRPVRVSIDRSGFRGGHVQTAAGPWRTSGAWWEGMPRSGEGGWDRDEWDVTLTDGVTYRVFHDRLRAAHGAKPSAAAAWFVEGVVD